MTEQHDGDYFGDGAAYERYVGRWSRPVARMFLDWLDQPSDLGWVDVGCGTGALSATVLDRAAPRRVIGVEPSEDYLEVARRDVRDARADFRLGDAGSLPVPDAEVGVAVSGLVLNFVPDQPAMVAEMRRVVGPGGTVALYVWDYAGEMQLMRRFWDAAAELFDDGARYDEGRRFPVCRPEPLATLFRDASLEDVETTAIDAPTVFAGFEDYWSPFLLGEGPAGAYCMGLSEDDRARLRTHLERTLPVSADGRIELIARAWAVRGTA